MVDPAILDRAIEQSHENLIDLDIQIADARSHLEQLLRERDNEAHRLSGLEHMRVITGSLVTSPATTMPVKKIPVKPHGSSGWLPVSPLCPLWATDGPQVSCLSMSGDSACGGYGGDEVSRDGQTHVRCLHPEEPRDAERVTR